MRRIASLFVVVAALLVLGFLIAAQLAAEGPRIRYTTQDRSPLVDVLVAVVLARSLPDDLELSGPDNLDRIIVHCDEPLPLQVDGEDTGDVYDVVYEAERDAVTVFV